MMQDDEQLPQQLNRPPVPKALENKIRENWAIQCNETTNKAWRLNRPALAFSITIVFAVVTLQTVYHTPTITKAALQDITSDSQQKIGITVPINHFAKQHQFHLPPPAMPIKMTKYCTIDETRTLHLLVENADQSQVHFFIHPGEFKTAFWQATQGQLAAMSWKLIQPKKQLSVLVLHTQSINQNHLEDLIQTMFYT